MSFNVTHTFRNLNLEFQADEPFMFGLAPFRDDEGLGYYLPLSKTVPVRPKPKHGEVWKFTAPTVKDRIPLRFVDSNGRLRNFEGSTQWIPDLDDLDELYHNYTKVLNADGSPA